MKQGKYTVTTQIASARTMTAGGRLIELLHQNGANAPTQVLDSGKFRIEIDKNGQNTFYFVGIRPMDLEAFKQLVADYEMPKSLKGQLSSEAWDVAKQSFVKDLVPITH